MDDIAKQEIAEFPERHRQWTEGLLSNAEFLGYSLNLVAFAYSAMAEVREAFETEEKKRSQPVLAAIGHD